MLSYVILCYIMLSYVILYHLMLNQVIHDNNRYHHDVLMLSYVSQVIIMLSYVSVRTTWPPGKSSPRRKRENRKNKSLEPRCWLKTKFESKCKRWIKVENLRGKRKKSENKWKYFWSHIDKG